MRPKRRERYATKVSGAKTMPISIATINFRHEVNVAYVVRAAACFGANEVCVIGHLPKRRLINELSGSMYDYVSVRQFKSPSGFLEYARADNTILISAELPDDCAGKKSRNFFDYKFDFSRKYCIIVGNESYGVPVEISAHSDLVYVPMMGVGYCLNTAQTANILLYEASKQYCATKEKSWDVGMGHVC